ncbi:unnamed protein product (macronuclear) [Paramecium tetraurelia]|uniref:protein-tyrosine-phosphatase n=1 Tax=Paramecium tetraurelia TaxID=5888 RepID=A0BPG5_PARTE|nr:uncharacterized protein GSPATT00005181001 [Paramecium tetraurelia]CAK60432.1 unnamed protein product [Paramecium tetraurelia]|eukprot:XP_001427830.1 hypothetical protein (macronuclear) [Paramecium tetraurelia strain d4-2]
MDLILDKTSTQGALWLGNLKAAQNIKQLKENNIQTVITVANNILVNFKNSLNISHKIYRVEDTEKAQIIDYFDEIIKEISTGLNSGSVLVHCAAGISRSSACVIAYLMKTNKWPYEKTFYFVKEKRLAINPNPGFKKQLIQYSKNLQSNTQQLNLDLKESKDLNDMNPFTSGYSNSWGKLKKKNFSNPHELVNQLSQNLVKSPLKKIDQLNHTSTSEERQIYRQLLAKKLFVNTFSTKNSVSITNYQSEQSVEQKKTTTEKQPIRIKALLSMYKRIEYNILESERTKT